MKISNLLKQEKSQKQIVKLLYTTIVCVFLLLAMELIFQIPIVKSLFGEDALNKSIGNEKLVWVVLWLLMFAQVTIIPIPALPIYVFCNNTSLVANGNSFTDLFSLRTLFFTIFVVSACMAGSIVAYWLGRIGGKKTVKWIAGDEEEFNNWTKILNRKKGKHIYFATILFPIFPDDVLCIVAGALKMDFGFFLIANLIGKFIGAFCSLLFLRTPYICNFFQNSLNGGFPWALLIYSILLIFAIIALIIMKKIIIPKSCIDNRDGKR